MAIKITEVTIVDDEEIKLVKRLSKEFIEQTKQFENETWVMQKPKNANSSYGKSRSYFFEFSNGKRQGVHGFIKSVSLGSDLFLIDKSANKKIDYFEKILPSNCLEVLVVSNFPSMMGKLARALTKIAGIKLIDTAKEPDLVIIETPEEKQRLSTSHEVWSRPDQAPFSDMIREEYNGTCVITRCKIRAALQAAHIIPVSAGGDYSLENGLLLRADLHLLFDAGLMAIHPETKEVHFKGTDGYYDEYTKADIPDNPKLRENLATRWKSFKE